MITKNLQIDLPERLGFSNYIGPHLARTIMLKELTLLLENTDMDYSLTDFKIKVIDENILKKDTVSNRKKSYRHLKELYSLDIKQSVFHTLRWAWRRNEDENKILALLCALSRDVTLRISFKYISSLKKGEIASKSELDYILKESFTLEYDEKVIGSLTRNLFSSWTQSGHLQGKMKKLRVKPVSGPISLTYALYLGYLTGLRGKLLFQTIWVDVLDLTDEEINEFTLLASKKGWINYRSAGGMVEIEFPHLTEIGVDLFEQNK